MVMKLSDTVKGMNSENYKERFKAEARQLKIRIAKLEDFIQRYKDGTLDCEPSCSIRIHKKQLKIMKKYLAILEKRSEIEHVKF